MSQDSKTGGSGTQLQEQRQSFGDVQIHGTGHNTNFVQAGGSVTVDQSRTIQYITPDPVRKALNELLISCTVKLSVPDNPGLRTGFFIAPGKILTCAEAVRGADEHIKVSWQDQVDLEAEVIERKRRVGLAVLDLSSPPSNHPCVYLDTAVQAGDELYTYGYSDEFANGGYIEGHCEGLTEDSPPIVKFKTKQAEPELGDAPLLEGSPLLNWETLKVCGMIVKSTDASNHHVMREAISAGTILEEINRLKQDQAEVHKKDPRWSKLLPLRRCKRRTVLWTSLGMTILVFLVRAFQVFQPFELNFYDQLIRNRRNPSELDDRFLIVTVTQQDVEAQEKAGEWVKGSLSNATLTRLLERVEELNPVAIGLDFYREQPLNDSQDQALKRLFQTPNLFAVCKFKYDGSDVQPPFDIVRARVGFSDFSEDRGGILRRQLLAFYNDPSDASDAESRCPSNKSLNLLLAEQYLQKVKNIKTTVNVDPNSCQIKFDNEVVLPNLQRNTGGYQGYSSRSDLFDGCQLLLNYRGQDAYKTVNLKKFLNPKFPGENYENRIVLIGIDRSDAISDNWRTPYEHEENTPGVVIQAQMVSQVIDAALEKQNALIWVLPRGIDRLLILGFAVGGGALGWRFLSPRKLGIGIVVTCGSVMIISFFAFQLFNGWVPLMPHFLALSGSSICVWYFNLRIRLGVAEKR